MNRSLLPFIPTIILLSLSLSLLHFIYISFSPKFYSASFSILFLQLSGFLSAFHYYIYLAFFLPFSFTLYFISLCISLNFLHCSCFSFFILSTLMLLDASTCNLEFFLSHVLSTMSFTLPFSLSSLPSSADTISFYCQPFILFSFPGICEAHGCSERRPTGILKMLSCQDCPVRLSRSIRLSTSPPLLAG